MFINIQNLSFSYQDKKILNDISFEVERGSIVSIVGSSGSGKSTMLKIIAGLIGKNNKNIKSGEVLVNNQDPLDYQKSGKLSLMFQEANLFPNLLVKENIALPLKIKNMDNDQVVEKIVSSVGLSKHLNKLPNQLSGGMKTRVALARAFVTKPELLLLDEPFSSLDVAWKNELYTELKELKNKNNTTVVLVTHDVEEAVILSDKIICLGIEGSIIKEVIQKSSHNQEKIIKELIIENHKITR